MKEISIKANEDTIAKINYIKESLKCSKADVLEACVTIVYSAIVAEQEKRREKAQ